MSGPTGLRRFVSDGPAGVSPGQQGPGPVTEEPGRPAGGSRGVAPPGQQEKCEFCATGLPAEHGHVADLEQSSLMCACRACYLLFTHGQAARGRYRSVPDRYLVDPARPMTAAEWDALEIPVGLAFFLHSSAAGQVTGFYPSPAGATECRLDLAAWDRLAADHPLLAAMAPDVEAALICRTAGPDPAAPRSASSDPAAPRSASSDPAAPPKDSVEHFLVPIDTCYELAGRMRLYWRGFDGGEQARQSIAEFLDRVRALARPLIQES
jgi:uncharacterized protein DUF5947